MAETNRPPIFWIHVGDPDGPKSERWAVRWRGRYYYTHKVWLNAVLSESVQRESHSPHYYIRGEGYVQVNDDGSISIY